jgi:serine/threonine-protein kinase
MTRNQSDQNLLFGILAVQLDLISRDDLIDAMSAWVVNKEKSLGEILRERGTMALEDNQLVDAIVARHLAVHGQDVEASLAALKSSSLHLADLASLPWPDGGAMLSGCATNDGNGSSWSEATTSWHDSAASEAIPRFRMLRRHAKGAIGQVSVAIDVELNREVAVKEIRPEKADDPESRARFLVEAEVTGRLEHPAIVPVYARGIDASGNPYYAMRFVRGETLKDAIASFHGTEATAGRQSGAWNVALTKLLRRLIEVCDAISYAHNRGVIHRDLKPANILLGPYGETLVVDWGLAKVVGRERSAPAGSSEATLRPAPVGGSAETVAGSAVGTPAYMSPEQAVGHLDRIGPASDVYGLGATLYCLLTGEPPFKGGDVATVLRAVERGQFLPPRKVNRRVPHALEAVVLKAMALKPEDRYPSARALADDIENWLAGESVRAWREPATARLRRWIGRHQKLAAATAAAVLVATLSLAVVAVILQASARREFRARIKANDNLRLACTAVDRFFTKVSEDSRMKASGVEKLRRDLLTQAKEFYALILQETNDEPRQLAEQGRTYLRLSRLCWFLGERDEAAAHGERALKTFEHLTRSHPGVSEFDEGLAKSLYVSSVLHRGESNGTRSRYELERSEAIWSRLGRSDPSRLDYQHERIVTLNTLGSLLCLFLGEPTAGEQHLERSLSLSDELLRAYPDLPNYRKDHASAKFALGSSHAYAGKLDSAIEKLEAAARMRLDLAKTDPDDPEIQRDLTDSCTVLAQAYCNANRPGDVQGLYEQVEPVVRRLARDHPDVLLYKELHTLLDATRAWSLSMLGDHVQAAQITAQAVSSCPKSGTVQLLAATCYSHAVKAARADDKLRPSDRDSLAGVYRTRALESLRAAQALGLFTDPSFAGQLTSGSDFEPLRDLKEFQALLAEVSPSGPAQDAARGRSVRASAP